MQKVLTIGFCTRNDVMAWGTLNSLFMHHPRVRQDDIEIVVVDNSTSGEGFDTLLEQHIKELNKVHGENKVRYIRAAGQDSSCLYKERLAREALGKYVMCMDSHVLLEPGFINELIYYHDLMGDHNNLLMGPCYKGSGILIGSNQMVYASEPYKVPSDAQVYSGVVCRGGSIGVWVIDPRVHEKVPFEIMQQGTGFFSFIKKHWWHFNDKFYGHGGNETYLMEKVRASGGKVYCVPSLKWVHSFYRPQVAVPYKTSYKDRVHNYLLGFKELGKKDLYDAVAKHMKSKCPATLDQMLLRIPFA